MIITEIDFYIKTKARIYIDYSLAFVLKKWKVEALKLSVGQELSREQYEEIRQELIGAAKLRAMNLLMVKDRTEGELRRRLKQDGYNEEIIDIALAYVQSYGYIDDKRYVTNYLNYSTGKLSKRALSRKLMEKGLKRDLVDQAVAEADIDDRTRLQALMNQHYGDITLKEPKERQRIYNYFLRRGFSYQDILSVMKEQDSF